LTEEKVGKIFCLAGIGGHISGMIETAKGGKRIIGIDGCPVTCAKKTLEYVGLKITDYVVVTDLGIEKKHDFKLNSQDIETIKKEIRNKLSK